ncbi:hypothetical protein ACTXOR_16080 [Arthrobacter rhombi]|uniref:hypothetical protein n=1 Tax=Arthrobacter rhombi TaxID=71253 RepID=UPI003FD30EA0
MRPAPPSFTRPRRRAPSWRSCAGLEAAGVDAEHAIFIGDAVWDVQVSALGRLLDAARDGS